MQVARVYLICFKGEALTMRCPSCGTKNKTGHGRCAQCGAPLDPRVAAFGGAARTVRESWGLAGHEEAVPAPKRSSSPYLIFAIVALVLIIAMLVAILLMQRSNAASSGYTLNTETFADQSLLAIVQEFDTNGDGHISPTEAAAVTKLDCSGAGLHVLAGIELFTNLEVLDASNNQLAAIDLTQLTNLREVNLADNSIHELDLSNHTQLVSLNVSDNRMVSLNVQGCTALEQLICPGNSLARLDLGDCTALTELVCDASQNVTIPISEGFFPDAGLRTALASLDTNGDGALTQRERQNATTLSITEPSTASIYGIAWIEGLTDLDISNTLVGHLDASELPTSLTSLKASNCELTSVDLAGLDRLTTLDLSYNPLTTIDLSALPRLTNVNLANCALSGTLNVTANSRLDHLDISGNPRLTAVNAQGVKGLEAQGSVVHDAACTVDRTQPVDTTAGDAPEAAEATPDTGDTPQA